MDRVRRVGNFAPPRKVQRPRPPKAVASGTRVASRSGPGEPPPGFMGGPMSLLEWYIYWALTKVLGEPRADLWDYQVPAGGGRAIIDFVVYKYKPNIAIRGQGTRFHVATSRRTQMYDERSKRMLERLGFKVIDIWEDHVIGDPSGRAVIQAVVMALKGQQHPNPITAPESLARPGRV